MHEGTIVECGPTNQILQSPRLSYTRQLVRALPALPLHLAAGVR
jgi:ABC-type oligopeptide transport system ATPase subunit